MINLVPVPTWRQWFKIPFFKQKIDDHVLAKPWLRAGDHAFFFSKSAWSLQAIVFWWEFNFNRTKPNVWLPDYFCNQSLTPLRATDANLIFYPINQHMQPDWQVLPSLTERSPPDIFILVHYFGVPTATIDAKRFCKQYQSLLIEDAAHVLIPISGVGEAGDFVLYSPHKLLAIPDGAVCVMRHHVLKQFSEAVQLMEQVRKKMGTASPSSRNWLIKRLIQKLIPDVFLPRKKVDFNHVVDAEIPNTPQQSRVSKTLISENMFQLRDIAEKRKYSLHVWQYLLADLNALNPLHHDAHATPYLALFQGENPEITHHHYKQLQNLNIPVTTWPDLPPEIHSKENHATWLCNTLIAVPVHQTLSIQKILKQYSSHFIQDRLMTNSCYSIQWHPDQMVWEKNFKHVSQSNLLQSWNYGEAKKQVEGWQVNRGLILKDDHVIGLFQYLEKKFLFVSVVRLNRGPLWISQPTEADLIASFKLIRHTFSLKKRKLLLIAPELSNAPVHQIILNVLKFRNRKYNNWQSAWVNLQKSEIELRRALHGKWRNQLTLVEKKGLQFQSSSSETDLKWLMSCYGELQKNKQFCGISISMVQSLHALDTLHENLLIMKVSHNNHPIAGALIIVHGQAATYVIGWNSEEGRKLNAMNLLLWNTLINLKQRGINWFDLGGLNDKMQPAIAKFKRGLNGCEYTLAGEYI